MPVVIAVWPNSTISVMQVSPGFAMADLFDQIDKEANPFDAKLYLMKPNDGWSHLTFNWKRERSDDPNDTRIIVKKNSGKVGSIDGKLTKIKFPPNIYRMWARRHLGEKTISEIPTTMTADEIAEMPAEPTETYEVDELRRMKPFCGVYLAFNSDGSCHYVGESLDVTKRVSKGREEIGARRIGVVKCEEHERKRIEAYFIAMLDPPGNACSTHRMKSRRRTCTDRRRGF